LEKNSKKFKKLLDEKTRTSGKKALNTSSNRFMEENINSVL
jgi:hypothetical protein